MKKVCCDCGKTFSPLNNRPVRCKACQEIYRKTYEEGYWNDITTNSHQSRYYQYAKFVSTLKDDEITALITHHIHNRYHAKTGAKREYSTYIKILQTEYSKRHADRGMLLDDATMEEIDRSNEYEGY